MRMMVVVMAVWVSGCAQPDPATNWSTWRGGDQSGVSGSGNPPVTWSEDENVAWKVPIPGRGSSSPIVWEDRVYVTTAITTERTTPLPESENNGRRRRRGIPPAGLTRYDLIAFDREDGRKIW